MIRDPYKVLGVSRDASPEEIKKAYRTLAKKYHPDLHPGDASAEEKMNEINVAYDMINNPSKYRQEQARESQSSDYDYYGQQFRNAYQQYYNNRYAGQRASESRSGSGYTYTYTYSADKGWQRTAQRQSSGNAYGDSSRNSYSGHSSYNSYDDDESPYQAFRDIFGYHRTRRGFFGFWRFILIFIVLQVFLRACIAGNTYRYYNSYPSQNPYQYEQSAPSTQGESNTLFSPGATGEGM